MRCVICSHGETLEGSATVTLSRDGTMLVVKGVPARVCENFGEEYVGEEITGSLMQAAEEGARGGVEVDVSSTWHDHSSGRTLITKRVIGTAPRRSQFLKRCRGFSLEPR